MLSSHKINIFSNIYTNTGGYTCTLAIRERMLSLMGVGKTGTGMGTWDWDMEGKTRMGTWDSDIEGIKQGRGWDGRIWFGTRGILYSQLD